jgi:hypothetical protein
VAPRFGRFEGEILATAKHRLPRAFSVGGELPYSSKIVELLEIYVRQPGALADIIVPPFPPDPAFLDRIRELGFEAFYISFHKPTPD